MNMPAIRFEAGTHEIGPSAIVILPEHVSAKLPSRGQVAARVAMNGHDFETVLEPDGRKGHWLKVAKEFQGAAGNTVTITIEPTKDWPEPEIPRDFSTALADAPDIHDLWEHITPMARWEWVRWIQATRNPETRRRRVEVAISKLRSGKRRPCCFDLASCTDPDLSKNGKLVEIA